MNESRSSSELLAELAKAPNDEKLREATARAQLLDGDHAGSMKTLAERLINVTAHAKGSPLPSLHRKVLKIDHPRAEMDGEVFVRDFVCAQGRVLFFWLPESLTESAEEVRRSVRKALTLKLQNSDRKSGRKPQSDTNEESADE